MPGKDIVYNIALTIVSRQRIDGVISDLFDRQIFILPLAHQHLNERRCGKLMPAYLGFEIVKVDVPFDTAGLAL